MVLSPLLRRVGFDRLPGWRDEQHADAFTAFRRGAFQTQIKAYRTGALGIDCATFADAYAEARAVDSLDDDAARAFFERHFEPHLVLPDDRGRGFVTGFYEPVVRASPVETASFRVPLYGRPSDLVDVDNGNRPADLDPYFAFARSTPNGLVEYFDRAAIDNGALASQGLELAWLEDPVDAYFVHVQGAARLDFGNDVVRRVTYAAKSGQRFTGAGSVLIELGEMARPDVTMQSIRAWFRANPARVREVLHRNRSYIFFREASVDDPALGPIAAAKVPLTPGRSIAVDRLLHTFGTPVHVDAETLDAFGSAPFRRLMIAQDTGSAIVGPARGDLFAGSGDEAGEIAGVIRHDADFYVLVPRALAGDRP